MINDEILKLSNTRCDLVNKVYNMHIKAPIVEGVTIFTQEENDLKDNLILEIRKLDKLIDELLN
jgi:hypothetical protein